MSRIFYDEFINFGDFYIHLKKSIRNEEEKEDLWKLVDEFIHLKMMEIILDNLHEDLHERFLKMYSERPYDDAIVSFLSENMVIKFPILIENEMEYLQNELMSHFGLKQKQSPPMHGKDKKKKRQPSSARKIHKKRS